MRLIPRALVASTALGIAVAATACGSSSTSTPSGAGNRTVDVTMIDNEFQPVDLEVTKGETVTFKFKNDGKLRHEATLGDNAAQMQHRAEMTGGTRGHGDDMGHGSDASDKPTSITVDPGKTGEITHKFNESGTIIIGCHEPGHWESGMKADVVVN